MFERIQSLLGSIVPGPLDEGLKKQIAHAIKVIDPRLLAFGNYPRGYIKSIEMACGYAETLTQSLPEPINLSPGRFASDPLLHTLFTDVGAINTTVHESRELMSYCHNHGKPKEGELFALMGMRRHEKTVLGREVAGDQLQSDVQQRVVYFDSHTLCLPVATREAFTLQVKQHLFDSLIQRFRSQMVDSLEKRKELQTQRDIMVAREHSHNPLNAGEEARLDAVRRELEQLDREYALTNYPSLLANFIAEQQSHLRMERVEIPIDMRGVVRESHDRLGGRFTFYDLIGRDRRRWTICPVRLPVAELHEVMQCQGSGKERWMEL
ncbi:MAG: hypothetical protein OEZ16_11685 [Chromatiales bacterium]|nr:hypothetical protein [Chromatiales bacterium]